MVNKPLNQGLRGTFARGGWLISHTIDKLIIDDDDNKKKHLSYIDAVHTAHIHKYNI